MIEYNYNGINYIMVINKALFNCINVLFMGFIFIENKRYKKYINSKGSIYLLEA